MIEIELWNLVAVLLTCIIFGFVLGAIWFTLFEAKEYWEQGYKQKEDEYKRGH